MKKRIICLLLLFFVYGFYVLFLSSVRDDGKLLVAVIDSGVDYTHDVFKGRVITGVDFVDNDYDPMDENGHGTHVTSPIIQATERAEILAIRTMDERGEGRGASLAGVFYAIWKKADIVNMSYSETHHFLMPLLIWYGDKRGMIFVASTGNEGKETINYPANYSKVIAIGAFDPENHTLYEASNLNQDVQFVAPGVRIEGADIHNQITRRSGTSMAAAYTSGIIAYLLEQNPTYTRQDLLDFLTTYATKLPNTPYQQLEFARLASLHDAHVLYASIRQTTYLTNQETYALTLETQNIERIDVYDERERLLFSTTHWQDTLPIPLQQEGYQSLTLRFWQQDAYIERTLGVIKDTTPPIIRFLGVLDENLHFVVEEDTASYLHSPVACCGVFYILYTHCNEEIKSNKRTHTIF